MKRGDERVRSLVVAPATPWGAAAGYRFRMRAVMEGLQRLGPVDVCVLHPDCPAELDLVPADVSSASWVEVRAVGAWRWRALWSSVTPERLSRLDLAMSNRFARIASGHNLTWCIEPRGFAPVRSLLRHPIVLDLHNLDDRRARLEQASTYPIRRRSGNVATMLRKRIVLPRLATKWEHWQRAALADVDAVVVCSELDAHHFGGPCVVIPNAYPPFDAVARTNVSGRAVRGSFTMAFVGTLAYLPNQQAVRFFAREVLPRLRMSVKDATFRVVGDRPDLIDDVRGQPGVSVVGYVEDIDVALEDVDVVVAPIFFGGGTRLKVIEGFARGIPVVATSLGAEGIAARDGVHLLLADDASAFSEALVRLHSDAALRTRLVDAAREFYAAHHAWPIAVDAVEVLARHVTGARISGADAELSPSA